MKTASLIAGGFWPSGLTPDFAEEAWLLECYLVVALIFDIFFDGRLLNTDGGNEVASSPKNTFGKLFGFLFYPT